MFHSGAVCTNTHRIFPCPGHSPLSLPRLSHALPINPPNTTKHTPLTPTQSAQLSHTQSNTPLQCSEKEKGPSPYLLTPLISNTETVKPESDLLTARTGSKALQARAHKKHDTQSSWDTHRAHRIRIKLQLCMEELPCVHTWEIHTHIHTLTHSRNKRDHTELLLHPHVTASLLIPQERELCVCVSRVSCPVPVWGSMCACTCVGRSKGLVWVFLYHH